MIRSRLRATRAKAEAVARVWRASGPRGVAAAVARRLALGDGSVVGSMMVGHDEALAVDWSTPHPAVSSPRVATGSQLHLAWITSPPGRESGGHQNMWRFAALAEAAGHRCTMYLYDTAGTAPTPAQVRAMVNGSDAFADLKADIRTWSPQHGVAEDEDAILATGWETAYASYRDPSPARRLYFVQDFEPSFYPVGTVSALAENTYRFGFHGVTAGGWLATELATRYGMTTDHFDFAADAARYRCTNLGDRRGVFFYARPVTARRAYEMGILALEAFHLQRPEAEIHLAGWKVDSHTVPFAHRSHGSLPLDQLAGLYNRCATGLVLSLTNLSLLPLELLAAGVTPVVNDAPNNRLVSDNPRFAWTQMHPQAIARALVAAYDANVASAQATANSDGVGAHTWEDSGAQFVEAVERHVRS